MSKLVQQMPKSYSKLPVEMTEITLFGIEF